MFDHHTTGPNERVACGLDFSFLFFHMSFLIGGSESLRHTTATVILLFFFVVISGFLDQFVISVLQRRVSEEFGVDGIGWGFMSFLDTWE